MARARKDANANRVDSVRQRPCLDGAETGCGRPGILMMYTENLADACSRANAWIREIDREMQESAPAGADAFGNVLHEIECLQAQLSAVPLEDHAWGEYRVVYQRRLLRAKRAAADLHQCLKGVVDSPLSAAESLCEHLEDVEHVIMSLPRPSEWSAAESQQAVRVHEENNRWHLRLGRWRNHQCRVAGPQITKRRLSDKAEAVYELLKSLPEHKAMTAPKIMSALRAANPPITISENVFTSRIVPELRPWGLENQPRIGYYIDRQTKK